MTKEELLRQLKWTDELQSTKALGADLTDFYYQSRKEELLAVYEMLKRPKSYEEMRAQIVRNKKMTSSNTQKKAVAGSVYIHDISKDWYPLPHSGAEAVVYSDGCGEYVLFLFSQQFLLLRNKALELLLIPYTLGMRTK